MNELQRQIHCWDSMCEKPYGHPGDHADSDGDGWPSYSEALDYIEEAGANPERAGNGCMVYRRSA